MPYRSWRARKRLHTNAQIYETNSHQPIITTPIAADIASPNMDYNYLYFFDLDGGEGGIRTPGSLSTTPDFESGAFNRTLPPLRRCSTLADSLNATQSHRLDFASRKHGICFYRVSHLGSSTIIRGSAPAFPSLLANAHPLQRCRDLHS